MRKRFTGFNNGGNMLNINEPKINEVVQNIHEAMVRKSKRGGKSSEEIITESRIFSIICSDFDLAPSKVASLMNSNYGYDMTSDEVIQIFRSRKMANPNERKELFKWADNVARLFKGAMLGKKEKFEKLESLRKEPALKSGKKHDSQDRIAAIMIYERYPEIDIFDDRNSLYLLGNTVAKYFFYDMVDAVRDVYFFNQDDDENKPEQSEKKNKLSYEQAIRRVEQLEGTLERTNTMLQDLQDEFEEQLEAGKIKELADFFAMLNSEKYGCILDELLVVRKGVDALRKSNYELPIEINGLLIMVKKLVQFVRDSHIEPMMKIDSIREVSATDIEFCNYEGSPFDSDKTKRVKVISPGWIYKDKDLQISRPKVKEVRS